MGLASLVSLVLELTGSHIDVHRSFDIGNSDPHYLVANIDQIRRHTGWSTAVNLVQGISDTIDSSCCYH